MKWLLLNRKSTEWSPEFIWYLNPILIKCSVFRAAIFISGCRPTLGSVNGSIAIESDMAENVGVAAGISLIYRVFARLARCHLDLLVLCPQSYGIRGRKDSAWSISAKSTWTCCVSKLVTCPVASIWNHRKTSSSHRWSPLSSEHLPVAINRHRWSSSKCLASALAYLTCLFIASGRLHGCLPLNINNYICTLGF